MHYRNSEVTTYGIWTGKQLLKRTWLNVISGLINGVYLEAKCLLSEKTENIYGMSFKYYMIL